MKTTMFTVWCRHVF